ncbi:ABC-type transport auxiliary lipoprotein family protein [Ochrobactrum sp. Marseille-Q0166]|uniref:ABC-type transport auxiliary lipoprotein family protein n=1 Tax=Ochrobactrum sp. Marseille-Q0166 TaxID=2761105 RepID=UPI001655C471|nr:ABC-type transport auxiliary lipoprotein family protein [Ochrobactrum sp. Marseille-Q0166]MBC8717452.1 membrane integrity-associated transporter subunit PqiC [Ochrobactrum sp. Marseille-Q0166]
MSITGSIVTKSPRKLIIPLLLTTALVGCGTTTPLDTFSLSAPQQKQGTSASRKNLQILVPLPNALKALDSENIVVNTAPGAIEYLKGAQWGDRLPNLVQSRLVQAYENTGVFGGVGRPGDGLAINYQILSDLRVFSIQAYGSQRAAVVEIAVRLMNDKNGEVRSTRVFRASTPVRGTSNNEYVRALDKAFEQVASEIVSWTISSL